MINLREKWSKDVNRLFTEKERPPILQRFSLSFIIKHHLNNQVPFETHQAVRN